MLDGAFTALGSSSHSSCRFVGDNAQAVTAFPTESVHQAPRLFMGQSVGFAAAIAQHRPAWLFQVTRHRTKCGQRCPRPLAAFEFRFSFLEESSHAFILVFTRK